MGEAVSSLLLVARSPRTKAEALRELAEKEREARGGKLLDISERAPGASRQGAAAPAAEGLKSASRAPGARISGSRRRKEDGHMATTTNAEWSDRDELASMFMQAIIAGKVTAGAHPDAEAKPLALKAYQLADAFLSVRSANAK